MDTVASTLVKGHLSVTYCNVLYYIIKHVCLCQADDQTNYYIIGVYDIACMWRQLSDTVLRLSSVYLVVVHC